LPLACGNANTNHYYEETNFYSSNFNNNNKLSYIGLSFIFNQDN